MVHHPVLSCKKVCSLFLSPDLLKAFPAQCDAAFLKFWTFIEGLRTMASLAGKEVAPIFFSSSLEDIKSVALKIS